MAPKKGTKREAAAAEGAAKKARQQPASKHAAAAGGVCSALWQASDLPEGVKKMLLAGVSHALCIPRDERHEVQQAVVSMIGEVVEGVRAKLQEAVETENGKLSGVEARRAELQAQVAAAQEALAAAGADVEAKAAALQEATSAALSAQGALKEKQAAQSAGDADLIQAKETKAAIESGLSEHLSVLKEGTAADLDAHFEALLPTLEGLALDESLMNALPSVCKKPAAERGSFDTMVVDQLSQTLADRAAALTKTIEEASPAAAAREAEVQAAQAATDAAKAAQDAASEALAAASAGQQAAKQGLKSAKAALSAFQPEYKEATQARDEQAQALADFKLVSLQGFESLRDLAADADATAGGA